MRATLATTVFGFVLAALAAGCPPSFSDPCLGVGCDLVEDAGGHDTESVPSEAGPPPSITGATVEDNSSRKIRQGFGAAPTQRTTTVHLTGEHLDSVTDVRIGTVLDDMHGTIAPHTATELAF